jgi:hypothetical protein
MVELPTVSRRIAKAWWANRRGEQPVDDSVDDYVEFLASHGYTGGAALLALVRWARADDNLELLGTWVLEELAQSEGKEALLVLSSTALNDAQRRSILAGFRAPWDAAP